ncbi:hypothetical protein JCM19301_76 [Jejuia pallidilutea]|uniref:6-bladed beta-propeller n=1 Tax=Jejuia pallidilutea TaxID=504487 RepID=A0A090VWV0_9FLAO|nr:hypothetical protein JCM19301_76 [Jejuia pallidilutea]GAL89558.1 hypothetical protein JCM19538_540 [Jejuia pallidilutea]
MSIIKQHDNEIFILDTKNTKKLFCFSLEGNLKWEFGSIGKGPLEYNRPTDFVINKAKDAIHILDNSGYKIITVDLKTGIALNEFNLNCYALEMVLTDTGDFLVNTSNLFDNKHLNYKLLCIDSSQAVISKNLRIPKNQEKKQYQTSRSLAKFGNNIFFTETLNDTIYRIKADTLTRAYYIDFKKIKYPEKLIIKYSYQKTKKLQKKRPFVLALDKVREKNGILNFSFYYGKEIYTVFYKIKDNKTFIFHTLKNGKTLSDDQQILPFGYINEGFVDIIEPYLLNDVKKLLETNKAYKDYLIENKPEVYNLILSTEASSNPILFIYEFKI